MPGVKRNLFGFSKKIVRVSVQHHLADDLDGHLRFWNELGRIQNVESQLGFLAGIDDLNAQFPLRKVAAVDRFP